MSHFGNIGHHLIVAIIDIYRPYTQWLGDVKNGDMTNDPCQSFVKTLNSRCSQFLNDYVDPEIENTSHTL